MSTSGAFISGVIALALSASAEPASITCVTTDAHRELVPTPYARDVQLAIGPDGTAWMLRTDDLVEVDGPASYTREGPLAESPLLRVDGDGVPWALAGSMLWRLEDGAWTIVRRPSRGEIVAFDVGRDGSVWSVWDSHTGHPPYGGASRLTGDTWTDLPMGEELATALAVDASSRIDDLGIQDMQVGPDGKAWVLWRHGLSDYRQTSALFSFDGTGWASEEPFESRTDVSPMRFDVGDDGTAWVLGEALLDPSSGDVSHLLARRTNGAWSTVDVPGEVESGGQLAVGPDGTLWLSSAFYVERGMPGGCDGAWSFSTGGWAHHLEGSCVVDLDIAPDGSVWVVEGASLPTSEEPAFGTSALKVITCPGRPTAGSGSEQGGIR